MRLAIALATMVALAVTASEAQTPGTPAQSGPSADAIVNSCGARLVKLFTQFGVPNDVYANREDENAAHDTTIMDYGSYGFKIFNKTATISFFWSGWKGPVKGISIGDSRDDVPKVLPNPNVSAKDANGAVTEYAWDLKDLDAKFYVDFDANGKVSRMFVELN